MKLCPTCGGEKRTVGIACGPNVHCRPSIFLCFRCKGIGQIPEEMMGWIKLGEKIRQARREKDISLREQAKKLGVLPSKLSEIENGRIDPQPFLDVKGELDFNL